jgi:16S rRNA (cytosine967-C5)-methyltransferase
MAERTSLIDLNARLLREVLRFEQPADRVLAGFFRSQRSLGPRERHALAETTYAVLRRLVAWRHLAGGGPGSLERRLVVLAWAGDPRLPSRVLEAREQDWLQAAQARQQALLAGATGASWALEAASRDAAGSSDPGNPALHHHLPPWVAEPLQLQHEPDDFEALAQALAGPAPLDLRVNTHKARREDVQATLQAAGVRSALTPYSPWGLRVEGKPSLMGLAPLLHGEVEVQDEGSQLLALLSGASRGEMVADFCAGAGGKTLAMGAMMRSTGRLYAFDTSLARLEAMKPRLARSGLSNVHPVAIAHERDDRIRRLRGKIDRALVDAPCSGLGTLRRNPDLKWRQSPEAVQRLVQDQQAILDAAAQLLRPGGRLVYATCSLLRAENEDVALRFTEAQRQAFEPLDAGELLDAARVPQPSALVESGFLRLWPHRHGTDAFFAAVWRRR